MGKTPTPSRSAKKAAKKAAKRDSKKRKLESGSSGLDDSSILASTMTSARADSPATVFKSVDADNVNANANVAANAANADNADNAIDVNYDVNYDADTDVNSDANSDAKSDVSSGIGGRLDSYSDMMSFIYTNREKILSILTSTCKWKEEMSFASGFDNELEELRNENTDLKKRLAVAEGQIARMGSQVQTLNSKTTDLTVRSMGDNVLIKNMDEIKDETQDAITRKVTAYFAKDLNVQENDLKLIDIQRAHRIGKFVQGRVRHIVVKLNSKGKDIIMAHWKNLHPECPIRMAEQYPPEVHARREKLWPVFTQAKEDGRKAKWLKDQLMVDGKVLTAPQDKVTDVNIDTIDVASQMKTNHTPMTTKEGSHFQAHSVPIQSKDDVIPAIKALCADSRVSGATHVMYAYRVGTERYSVHNWEDDGEWGAGRWIMGAIADRGVYNQLICISRWKNGQNLGKERFQIIKQLAHEAISDIK